MTLSSLAALALGAAPVQAQSQVQPKPATDQVQAEQATLAAPVAPVKPVWVPKPKPWPASDTTEPVAKPPATKP